MAEAMTVETIIEADWQMKGYWTKLRVPLRTPKGGWSDIDVVAYHPKRRHLVLCESKVRGPKKQVRAYTAHTKKRWHTILGFDRRFGGEFQYFGFLNHVGAACKKKALFDHFTRSVNALTIQLVSNCYVAPDLRGEAEACVLARMRSAVPRGVKVNVRIETTLDVIARIITAENLTEQGRRYGHPVIDIARELNRYMHPKIVHAGREKSATDDIRQDFRASLSSALGLAK